MPFQKRIKHPSYIENQRIIESKWDKKFGDRLNELVIIGQNHDHAQINKELEACLINEKEEVDYFNDKMFSDVWPVQGPAVFIYLSSGTYSTFNIMGK